MSIAVFKGVTTRWRLSGVPAETATVAVYCQSGAVRFEAAGVQADGQWWAEVGAAAVADAAVGRYQWSAVAVSAAGVKQVAGRGELTLGADPAVEVADTRGHAGRVLAAIEAVIEGRATQAQASMSVDGRSLAYVPLADLVRLRQQYVRLAAVERGRGVPQVVKTRFAS